MLGVVCHLPRHQCERGSAILNLGLAVLRWRFGPSREAFLWTFRIKKDPMAVAYWGWTP